MSAVAFTWRRLRRWYAINCLQARARQLDSLIQQMDAALAGDMAVLGALRMERRQIATRLAAANRKPTRPTHPITWGL